MSEFSVLLFNLFLYYVTLLRTHTDCELLTALKQGSESAFDELFRRYWNKAFEVAYGKVKSRALAEEIVQDIFMDLWSKRASISIGSFTKYLFASVKFQALNKLRSQLIHQKYWDYYKAFIPKADNATEKTVDFQNLLDTIEERLDQLPGKTKTIFYMSKLEGKSLKEIARIMKLSEKAIEYHLNRSLKDLRVYLRNTFLCLVVCLLVFAV